MHIVCILFSTQYSVKTLKIVFNIWPGKQFLSSELYYYFVFYYKKAVCFHEMLKVHILSER